MKEDITISLRSVPLSVVLLGLGMQCVAAGQDIHPGFPRPLPVNNQSPIMGVVGIPRAQGTGILGEDNWHWGATLDLTSHFQGSEAGGESIFLDGETARLAVQTRYGINDDWNLGVEVPWVHHGPGLLDHFIIEVENVPNSRVVSDVSIQLRLRTTPGGGQ